MKESRTGCMVAGKDNHGCDHNPMWACRPCCSDCIVPCKTPKCNGYHTDFCAWRTPIENIIWIDIFGDGLRKQLYRENMNGKEERELRRKRSLEKGIP